MAKKKDNNEDGFISGDYLDAKYITDNPARIINVSPAIDLMLGGGWSEGIIGILEAPPKVGKTTLALKIAGKAQQQYGKVVVYVMVEPRRVGFLKNLNGVPELDCSPDKFKIIASQKGKILSTEHFLEQTERALNDFPDCVIIFDSFSDLSSAKEKTDGYGEGFGLETRKMESSFARKIHPLIAVSNSTIIGIAHTTQNMSTPGRKAKISESLKYHLDITLSMKRAFPGGDWMAGDKIIGQKVSVECKVSALGGPGGEANLWLKYGQGFLDQAELAEMATDLDVITKGGAWFNLPERYEKKVQGFEKLVQYLIDEPTIYQEILAEVKGLLT